jgi:glycine/D-amino acid oxidase-like deaminating enzyme
MPITQPSHVVVIGGGILGASTAAHLARGGAQVTLVTAGSLGDGASGRSLAWLN